MKNIFKVLGIIALLGEIGFSIACKGGDDGNRNENDNGNTKKITNDIIYDANGFLIAYYEYEYDSKGNQTKSIIYSNNKVSQYTIYTYDNSAVCESVSSVIFSILQIWTVLKVLVIQEVEIR